MTDDPREAAESFAEFLRDRDDDLAIDGPLWSSRWVDEDPDPVMKEVELGSGRYFRCEPDIADFVVHCVNLVKRASPEWQQAEAKRVRRRALLDAAAACVGDINVVHRILALDDGEGGGS